ncbi:hypothetical protein [Mycobacterium sp.]|uniref:hypothetical protein n=1 Tax=Mycobacterium sp. TaxID=1785 RepID=UPI001276699E|nr:hypothetical protein [Mycobacterium sp.]KAA8967518.1 MAG: hypothetical protein F6Q13_06090 [Mycobacterium sp.]
MPLTSELPTLSEVESASFEHLPDSAAYFRRAADWAELSFTTLRDAARHPGGTEWDGRTADAYLAARERDLVVAGGAVSCWRGGDAVCMRGFEQMTVSRQSVLDAVAEVRAAGFEVADDYTVTETFTGGTPGQRQARRHEAQGHRNYLRHRVALLVAHDREVAHQMDAALGGLADITFAESGVDDTIVGDDDRTLLQAVDRHVPLDPAPTPGPTAQDIRAAIKDLPQGSRGGYLEVRSEAELRSFWDWLTQHSYPHTPPSPYRSGAGALRQLPDGTIVGIGPSDAHGTTMDARLPDGEYVKLHVNATTGGELNFPRPGAPVPRGAEPALGPRGPVERVPAGPPPARPAPPAARAPSGGGGGGVVGPMDPNSVPHPIHLPHSHHGPPILGKDDVADLPEFGPR